MRNGKTVTHLRQLKICPRYAQRLTAERGTDCRSCLYHICIDGIHYCRQTRSERKMMRI